MGDERLSQDAELDVEIHAPDALAPGGERSLDESANGSMRELARAFQANAEALRGIHDVQADLSTALRRGDRSELVLQSTKALNETFRNLTVVQRELLGRMEDLNRQANRSPVVPALILGMLVVLLGGIYVIVDAIQSDRLTAKEVADLRVDGAEGRLEAFQAGQAQASEELRAAVARLEAELVETGTRLETAGAERDAAKDEIERIERTRRSLEAERDELAQRALGAQNESMARTLVEDELRGMRGDLAVATRRLEQAEADLVAEREEASRLRGRLAAFGWGLPDEDELFRVSRGRDAPPAASDAAGDVDPPGAGFPPTAHPTETEPLGTPPTGSGPTDPWHPTGVTPPASYPGDTIPPPPPLEDGAAEVAPRPAPSSAAAPEVELRRRATLERRPEVARRIRDRVNQMLDAGRSRTPTAWQITQIGGYTRDRLGEVKLLQYDAQDRNVGAIEADELFLEYDTETETVELILKGGQSIQGGNATPLPSGGRRVVVGRGEDVLRLWRGSGLVMLKKKR